MVLPLFVAGQKVFVQLPPHRANEFLDETHDGSAYGGFQIPYPRKDSKDKASQVCLGSGGV